MNRWLPNLSVVICTRNRLAKLVRCLGALICQSNSIDEIVVVDQSDSQANLGDLFRESTIKFKYLWRRGCGVAVSRNRGIRASASRIICFTDDDCIPAPDWSQHILNALNEYPELDAVFGKVLEFRDQATQDLVTRHTLATRFGQCTYATMPGMLFCHSLAEFPERRIVSTPCLPFENLGNTNNMAIRRSAIFKYGGFIECLGTGSMLRSAEDTELVYRLLCLGCRMLWEPAAVVYHDNWLTPAENSRQLNAYTLGSVSLFVSNVLKGDRFSREFLRYRWAELKNEIADYGDGRSLLSRWGFSVSKTWVFVLGVIGGVWLLIYSHLIGPGRTACDEREP